MVLVAGHQHDDAPIVDVLQVHWSCGTQVLERASVVSSITSCPIHASGILSFESEALGLSLSITASSFDRIPLQV